MIREVMRSLGARGGRATASALTPEQREQKAKAAALARWKRHVPVAKTKKLAKSKENH